MPIIFDILPEASHGIGPADGLKVELVDGAEDWHALDVGGAPLYKVHNVTSHDIGLVVVKTQQ